MSALRRLMPAIEFSQARILYDRLAALEVTTEDFQAALNEVEPSALREVFTEVPDVGPPGTGKTLLAKALARQSEANFISVKGPQLLSMYLGESERAVREVFRKARQAAPCIIFFDEIDALAPVRSGHELQASENERVVGQLLTELDGIEDLRGVVALAATNRPDRVDPALLRAGRFDVLVELPLPDSAARRAILAVHTRRMPLAGDVDLTALAEATEDFSGADIEGLCRRAALLAMREIVERVERRQGEPREQDLADLQIGGQHFDRALRDLVVQR
jgi:transitional endoplasmic reticulum ATPase